MSQLIQNMRTRPLESLVLLSAGTATCAGLLLMFLWPTVESVCFPKADSNKSSIDANPIEDDRALQLRLARGVAANKLAASIDDLPSDQFDFDLAVLNSSADVAGTASDRNRDQMADKFDTATALTGSIDLGQSDLASSNNVPPSYLSTADARSAPTGDSSKIRSMNINGQKVEYVSPKAITETTPIDNTEVLNPVSVDPVHPVHPVKKTKPSTEDSKVAHDSIAKTLSGQFQPDLEITESIDNHSSFQPGEIASLDVGQNAVEKLAQKPAQNVDENVDENASKFAGNIADKHIRATTYPPAGFDGAFDPESERDSVTRQSPLEEIVSRTKELENRLDAIHPSRPSTDIQAEVKSPANAKTIHAATQAATHPATQRATESAIQPATQPATQRRQVLTPAEKRLRYSTLFGPKKKRKKRFRFGF